MSIYIALLRGINVGGHNKIKMADLRAALTAAGLERVQTYIQSGNVLLESDEEEASLRETIERVIAESFGIALTVVLRTAEELERLLAELPFPAEIVAEAAASAVGESLYAALLPAAPSEEGIAKLAAVNGGGDEFRVIGRDVYLLFRHSIRDSKLAAGVPKLSADATVRNWNTLNKLVELARGMREA